jgi:transcription elongation factor GreA
MEKRELFLTRDGAEKLRRELEELRGPRRAELAKRLRAAIQHGDLTENADYTTAKEEQAFLEGRVQELETLLKEATIVDAPISGGIVGIGNTVVVARGGGGDPEVFQLVGVKEADPRSGRISNESPIGRALMGKRVGETAIAQTPGGQVELTILEIR